MKLVRIRECDGQCCKDTPRFPNKDKTDCVYHIDNGCDLMRDSSLVPDTNSVARPNMTGIDDFISVCKQWPQFYPSTRKTGNCCLQWVNE